MKASSVEPAQDASPSVYDFLYQDSRRVSSLLAQFDSNGVLQSITRKEMYGETNVNGSEFQGDVDVVALKASGKYVASVTENHGGEAARAYDVLWSNSLSLLAYLQQHHFLQRDLSKARLGQIVLVSGSLKIYDLPLLKVIFHDSETVRILTDADKPRRKNATEAAKQKATFKLFTSMPLSVQAVLSNGDKDVWAVLNETCLESAVTDLFLKYGVAVAGIWNILGILDVTPLLASEQPEKPKELETAMDVVARLADLSSKLGRPPAAYGITPLLIFREVGNTDGE